MRHQLHGLAIVLLITVIPAAVGAAASAPANAPAQVSAGFLEQPFKRAESYFRNGQRRLAAQEIRRAAVILRAQIPRLPKEAKDDRAALEASAAELDNLARSIAKAGAKQLDQAFARTHYRLARYHQRLAAAAWSKKEFAEAGANLQHAAMHLSRAAAWESHRLDPARQAAARDARLVGAQLRKGTAVAATKVGPVIKRLGEEIEALGRKLRK